MPAKPINHSGKLPLMQRESAEIAVTSDEQAVRIGQVNMAVTGTDKISQNNAASAEESASASEELNAQAEKMRSLVNELTVLIGTKEGDLWRRPGDDYYEPYNL